MKEPVQELEQGQHHHYERENEEGRGAHRVRDRDEPDEDQSGDDRLLEGAAPSGDRLVPAVLRVVGRERSRRLRHVAPSRPA